LVTKEPIDETAFEAAEENLKLQLLLQKQNALYEGWMAQLRADAVIENNLRSFFPL